MDNVFASPAVDANLTGTQSNGIGNENRSINDSPPVKDLQYWFEGEYIVFQVENVLFRVPSHQFKQESDVFRGMLSLPRQRQGYTESSEGNSADNPIILPSTIRAEDFRNFLKAIYPLNASANIAQGLSKEELESVLKLSTMWYFLDFRKEAIAELSKRFDPAEKIAAGRAYKISQFMIDGFTRIITRDSLITDLEAVIMDPLTAVALLRIRELNWNKIHRRLGLNVPNEIEKQFAEELKMIRQDEEGYKKIEQAPAVMPVPVGI
ncbi:hypothetical protein HYPSUDRAFT_33120 [Hypholoma sublateritium FD-334 SS-4]|uniref:BTB domain-containing protein n=1 Tax=Hypholoma sublateritium (strain FD-334 SS-4) TaxID=945553 RepID=A0A0D2LLG0_HYPSF|nr:hypothetical protein HYPSUDRAFT_33120 [Hypholoma sublateritium FD-334 SS-4]